MPKEYAATITVNPLTALRMLEDYVALNPGTAFHYKLNKVSLYLNLLTRILTGDAIVQNGATSMVGRCVIQIAQSRGIHNINIVRDRY